MVDLDVRWSQERVSAAARGSRQDIFCVIIDS
jgi:hypothetical protein